jgi:hypothetical protein
MSKSLLFFAIEMHINFMLACFAAQAWGEFESDDEFCEVLKDSFDVLPLKFQHITHTLLKSSIDFHQPTKTTSIFELMNYEKILHCRKKHVLGVPRFNSNILLRNCSIGFQRAIIKQQIPCIKTPAEIKITTNPSHVIIQVPQ